MIMLGVSPRRIPVDLVSVQFRLCGRGPVTIKPQLTGAVLTIEDDQVSAWIPFVGARAFAGPAAIVAWLAEHKTAGVIDPDAPEAYCGAPKVQWWASPPPPPPAPPKAQLDLFG